METRARYVLIGVFTLVCIFAAYFFVYWIKAVGGLGQRTVYNIRFEQPIAGLVEGANVLFNGIRAGAVSHITLDPNIPKRVLVTISLEQNVPVRADTRVRSAIWGSPARRRWRCKAVNPMRRACHLTTASRRC